METFREVNDVTRESVFEWQIKDFYALSAEVDTIYRSPSFAFSGASWYFEIYPNGQTKVPFIDGKERKTVGYIGVTLFYESSGPPISLDFSFGIKTLEKKIDPEYHYTSIFESTKGHGAAFLISRSKFLERKSELISFDVLTFVCKLNHPKYMKSAYFLFTLGCTTSANYSYYDENFDIEDISYMERLMKCPDHSDIVSLKSWLNDHECQKKKTEKCSYCKKNLNAENFSTHEKMYIDIPIKCPDYLEFDLLQKWLDHMIVRPQSRSF